jgi:hypothetical protein
MNTFVKYFGWAVGISIGVLVALYLYTGSAFYLQQCIILAIIEISVSFDNAVVNASKLHKMNAFWRKMFLTVGILVAVGFMRLYIPLEIVSQFGNISLKDAYNLALYDHSQFSAILITSHDMIAGFGGAFLFMVALHFFFNEEKEVMWIKFIEKPFNTIGNKLAVNSILPYIVYSVITVLVTFVVYEYTQKINFFKASLVGIVTFLAVEFIKHKLEALDEKLSKSKFKWIAGGLGTFIYLEILDASFSLDGVITAFAISKDVFPITLGLGIGALFIRCLTIFMDDKGMMVEYKYLEHGAFWAITLLAVSMFIGISIHIPEWLMALLSIGFIGSAFVASLIVKRREAVTV